LQCCVPGIQAVRRLRPFARANPLVMWSCFKGCLASQHSTSIARSAVTRFTRGMLVENKYEYTSVAVVSRGCQAEWCQKVPQNEDSATAISTFETPSQPHRTRKDIHTPSVLTRYRQLHKRLRDLAVPKCGFCAADKHVLYIAHGYQAYNIDKGSHHQHRTL
jgi:hypothetical protein